MAGVGFLPLSLVVLVSACFATTLTISWIRGDVKSFPFISKTGTKPPESCIFSICLNIAVVFSLATMYSLYRQIGGSVLSTDATVLKLNRGAFIIGICSSIGLLVVANFQDTAQMLPVHLIGAAACFVFGSLYMGLQTVISFKTDVKPRLTKFRMFLTVVSVVSLISCVVLSIISIKKHWNVGTSGYYSHIMAAVSEWLMGGSFLVFFLTFYKQLSEVLVEVHVHHEGAYTAIALSN